MRKGTLEWLEIADGDYEVGLAAYKMARYPQAIYMLCQALEKVLKAAQIEFAQEAPKKTHELEIIARQTKLEFSQEQYDTLEELGKIYRRIRYPDINQRFYNTKEKVFPIYGKLKNLYIWTKKQFINH